MISKLFSKVLQEIFSIKNDKRHHKMIKIFGIKIKFKQKTICSDYENYLRMYSVAFHAIQKTKKHPRHYEKNSFEYFIKYFKCRYILTRKISIIHLEYKLLTQCTLNCEECCHYAPYFERQMSPVTFEEFKKGLNKLLKSVDIIFSLNFMGGEALLSKDLPKMIKYALTKKQIKNLNLTTNGLTLPSEELINTIKGKDNFTVYISDYSTNKALANRLKTEELKGIFSKNSIPYLLIGSNTWNKAPILSFNGEIHDTFSKSCWLSGCKTYANGNIYFCPLQFFADFNNLPLEIKEDEIVKVIDDASRKVSKNLIKFYLKDQYDFCKFCKIQPNSPTEVAKQTQVRSKREKMIVQ